MPYTFDQLVGFAQGAGFQGSSANTIAAIALAESGGDPNAINYSDPGGSYGLTQINGAAHGPTAVNTLGNPQEAFAQAFAISNGGSSFTPWSTYNSGAYLPFLPGGSSGSGNVVSTNASGMVTGINTGFLGRLGGGLGGILGGSSSGSGSQGLTGSTATGQPVTSQSPLSAIFASVSNLFQQGGLLILGAILVAIGAWYTAKPKGGG